MQKNTHTTGCPTVPAQAGVVGVGTVPENASTSRGYAGQLTDKQITQLEACDGQGDPIAAGASMVRFREMARRNRWDRENADVPAPADATDVGECQPEYDNETPARYFEGVRCLHVHIGGVQNLDGTVRERWISVETDMEDLDAATVRTIDRFLVYAADEMEHVAFAEAIDAWRPDIDPGEGISYRDACKAGVAVVSADADRFGVAL